MFRYGLNVDRDQNTVTYFKPYAVNGGQQNLRP